MKGCLTIFCHEIFAQGDVHIFLAEKFKEAILNFLLKMLSGETLCKFYQIFPPKVLVYIRTDFS